MKIPYSWLKELLPDAPSVDECSELFTSIGLAVEEIIELPAPPEGVVIAKIISMSKVEGSDKLNHCMVSDGKNEYSIVTAAPNTKEGMISALAKIGTELPVAGFTVSKRKLMGIESNGVLCSPKELGLYDYSAGLIELSDDLQLGASLAELWAAETVLDLEITPNRADTLSLLGVARDLAAKLQTDFVHPAKGLKVSDIKVDDSLKVEIENTKACSRFSLQRIDNVEIKPSPIWLQRRLASVGLRPRNNVVDITNYVTYELGQPSHAYDLDNLNDNTIIVRNAQKGESIVSLTEQEIKCVEDDLLITMPKGSSTMPIGLAGIIGGLNHSINPSTVNVALEMANFDPVTVRKIAKRHSIMTDAHYRFERGVDPNIILLASARASQLISEVAGGQVHAGITIVGKEKELKTLDFRPSQVEFKMTLDIPLQLQKEYLERLGCQVKELKKDKWQITAPSWRYDMEIEEDIVEEVSRLYGFDKIVETLPGMYFVPPVKDSTGRVLRSTLASFGLQEVISYIFTSDEELVKAKAPKSIVSLQNPQGVERSVLRTALYPSLINIATNNKQEESLVIFELGQVFKEIEQSRLSILMRGPYIKANWLPEIKLDFYYFKAILEKLARTYAVDFVLEAAETDYLHPGISAKVYWAGQEIGFMGKLHPEIAAIYGLKDVFVAELDLPLASADINFTDINRQPFAERDLAIILPIDVNYASLKKLVKENAGDYLQSLDVFDIYRGDNIEIGYYSMAIRLRFQDREKALTDTEVDQYMANVINKLESMGYSIRGK